MNKTQGSHKRNLIVIEPHHTRREQLVGALSPIYNIQDCFDGYAALAMAKKTPPDLILNGEDINSAAAEIFLGRLREVNYLQRVPVLFVLGEDKKYKAKDYKDVGAKHILFKPYLRNQLLDVLSQIFNAGVEEEWDNLPAVQRAALQNSVAVFNDIAESFMTGKPVAFSAVKNNCQSLVTAIENNDFKSVLDGVRNHDDYTYAHSMRVATLLTLLGHAAGFKNDDQLLLSSGGLLHDIGKMNIPHSILNKPARLTDDEYEIMKGHVGETTKYLKTLENIPNAIFIIAEQHHEKIDGTGYPYGLKGSELNELARMAAIVDVFSALTDRRVYKPPMPAEKAMMIMKDEMAGHLDQHYLKLFRALLFDAGVIEPQKHS